MDKLRQIAQSQSAPEFPHVDTQPPAPESWTSREKIASVLAQAATHVPEQVRTGSEATQFDQHVAEQIKAFQQRKQAAEGGEKSRLVHREQLHGGAAQIHWNPNMESLINLFGTDPSDALVRISDASALANPDGKTMFGFALEVKGPHGDPTDILLTGGTPRTEASQAKDPEAQLALFNMLNPSSKIGGLGRILADVGIVAGPRMLIDVALMRAELDSVSQLIAWSRAPFAVEGKDGKEYLVKMRVTPKTARLGRAQEGVTSAARLKAQFGHQLEQGEARWGLEFQFMQPGDNAYDPRETWRGPWLGAGEVALPQTQDRATAERFAALAENTNYNPWKGKTPESTSREKNVLRPWGELNRARLPAYRASQESRS